MDWLRRHPPPLAAPAPGEAGREAHEGAAPGVVALLDGVTEDRSHAVLDLGPATDLSLRVYGRFARWIRFADLLGDGGWPQAQGSAAAVLRAVPRPARPYDLVFAWDILDRIFPEERAPVVQQLANLTGPGARLHAIVRAADEAPNHPLRFSLLDTDRFRYERTGTGGLTRSGLLPAQVATLLAPFRVLRAFTLKTGLREYVAVRPAG